MKGNEKFKIVGVDVDDVLIDSFSVILSELNRRFGKELNFKDFQEFSSAKAYGVTPADIAGAFHLISKRRLFEKMKPIPGTQEAIKKLAKERVLFVATSRMNYLGRSG